VIERVARCQGGAAIFEEGEADEVVSGDGEGGFAGWGDAHDSALAVQAGGNVEVAVNVEGHALRAAESLVEDRCAAVAVDGVNGLIGGRGGAGDEERVVCVEREVVGGDGGFECGEDEDLAVGVDLKDGARAVADVEVAVAIEGDAGGDAHALGIGGHGAFRGDSVDGSFCARAGVEVAIAVEREACGIHQIADEGDHLEVALDAEDRDWRGLSTRAGKRSEDLAVGVDYRIGYGMEILGHGDGDANRQGVGAFAVAMKDEVAGDCALRHVDGGAGGA